MVALVALLRHDPPPPQTCVRVEHIDPLGGIVVQGLGFDGYAPGDGVGFVVGRRDDVHHAGALRLLEVLSVGEAVTITGRSATTTARAVCNVRNESEGPSDRVNTARTQCDHTPTRPGPCDHCVAQGREQT
jgi:hypothetical protein